MDQKMDFSDDLQLNTSPKLDNKGGSDKLLRGRRAGGLQAYFLALVISIALVYVVSKCAARIEEYSSRRVRRLAEKEGDSKDSTVVSAETVSTLVFTDASFSELLVRHLWLAHPAFFGILLGLR